MTTVTNPSAAASAATAATSLATQPKTGFGALGSGDFIKLLTAQLSQQDPTDPVDNKAMLAQLAQFSSLSGINDVNTNLKSIADKLDAVLAAQQAAASNLAQLVTPPSAANSPSTTPTT